MGLGCPMWQKILTGGTRSQFTRQTRWLVNGLEDFAAGPTLMIQVDIDSKDKTNLEFYGTGMLRL